MSGSRKHISPDKYAVRNWTLYAIKFTDGTYYVGITSYGDPIRRIAQHGGPFGARWNQGKILEEIVDVRRLGRIRRIDAENIENEVTLGFRKQFGRSKVRGGYNSYIRPSLIPNYTPGSMQMYLFLAAAVVIVLALLLLIVKF